MSGTEYCYTVHSRSNYTRVTDRYRVLFPRCKKSCPLREKSLRSASHYRGNAVIVTALCSKEY